MNASIVMPKVGLTMTEGKIVEWKKAPGDRFEKDEVLFVFETEKVTYEVEAQQPGQLKEILAGLEEVVPVGETVALLAGGEETSEAPARKSNGASAPVEAASAPKADEPAPPLKSGKVRATPLARRIARDNGVDLAELAASARGGRVRSSDVRAALERSKAEQQRPLPLPASQPSPAQPDEEGRLMKFTGMRKAIAEKLLASKLETAQAYMTCSVDATKLQAARAALAPFIEQEGGPRPTLTDLLLKIAAGAILRHPVINTRWTDEGVLWLDRLHMGLATALEDGLVVPVIADIAAMSLGDIAAARSDLVGRARAGKLAPEEMRGSSFTLSSLGMFGVEEFNSILNQPESAILAVGAIIDKPVSLEGEVVVRPIMKITLTYDHRIIDGAKAGAFLQTLKAMIEEPLLVLA